MSYSIIGVSLLILSAAAVSVELESTTDIALTSTSYDEGPRLLFDPPVDTEQIIHTRYYVQINVSSRLYYTTTEPYVSDKVQYFVGVEHYESDKYMDSMIAATPSEKVKYLQSKPYNLSYHLFWRLQLNNSLNSEPTITDHANLSRNGFILTINNLGYPKIGIHVIGKIGNVSTLIVAETYNMIAMRKYRTVDLGFTIAITAVGILNIFAIGCMTEVAVLRSQFRKSVIPVCIAAGTQYLITPLLAFALIKIGQVQAEIAVGILLCSCVPGGGLGHLIVLVTGNANTELSVAINFLQIFVPLGAVPLWLYSLGKFLLNGVGEIAVPTHYMVLCLGLLIVPYVLGVILKRFKPEASDAILNWLIKPLLLLFMILFITLGLYINIYVMGALDNTTLAMAGMIPCLGFLIGGGLTLVTKQGKASAKSVAIEAAIMNCLAVIAAAKLIMPQPDSDMACAGAIAVLFFTPLPFIGMLIFHKIKKKILNYFENRKFEKEQQETITKSFALITQNALQISGMTADQIKARKQDETLNNFDKTLLPDEDNSEPSQTVVQIKDDQPFGETVPMNQSNHRNFV